VDKLAMDIVPRKHVHIHNHFPLFALTVPLHQMSLHCWRIGSGREEVALRCTKHKVVENKRKWRMRRSDK